MSTNRGLVRVERGAKRVRVHLGGEVIADTTEPVLVWEVPYYPTYYIPAADVRAGILVADGSVRHSPSRGEGQIYTVKTARAQAPGAALRYADSPIEELRGLIRLDWVAMDAWFEEDEEVFAHPRDPHTRIDVLNSSRHIRVEIDGVTVAESSSPHLLFETGLPVRYYLPKTHVRMDLLEPAETVSYCPYKGKAEHWSIRAGDRVHADLAWSYQNPLPESQKIIGLVAFYNGKVDIYVDGVLQERPKSKFA
jgi:uncharacterized protein (DUF427 family)